MKTADPATMSWMNRRPAQGEVTIAEPYYGLCDRRIAGATRFG